MGTEHILLGLIRDGEGVAASVLTSLGVDLDQTRERVRQLSDKGRKHRLLSGWGRRRN